MNEARIRTYHQQKVFARYQQDLLETADGLTQALEDEPGRLRILVHQARARYKRLWDQMIRDLRSSPR